MTSWRGWPQVTQKTWGDIHIDRGQGHAGLAGTGSICHRRGGVRSTVCFMHPKYELIAVTHFAHAGSYITLLARINKARRPGRKTPVEEELAALEAQVGPRAWGCG